MRFYALESGMVEWLNKPDSILPSDITVQLFKGSVSRDLKGQ